MSRNFSFALSLAFIAIVGAVGTASIWLFATWLDTPRWMMILGASLIALRSLVSIATHCLERFPLRADGFSSTEDQ